MVDCINLDISDFGPINEANINIGKINVIAGQNSSGKSTASKLLYCFLKSNSSKRQEISFKSLSEKINTLFMTIRVYLRNKEVNEDLNDLLFNEIRLQELNGEFYNTLKLYEKCKNLFLSQFSQNNINRSFNDIDELIKIIEENQNPLYISIMRMLLKLEFSTKHFKGLASINGIFENNDFNFSMDFNHYNFNNDKLFECNGYFDINEVYYIDSISSLDLNEPFGLNKTHHVQTLENDLKDDESDVLFDDKLNKNIIDLEMKINDLIDGEINFRNNELSYITKNGIKSYMSTTSSGIKQIGIISLLLSNRKLKENSFLIMDEPEVNLHPEWQVKLAKILVLFACELNIHIYINSHNPMFVEAISVFSRYYNLEDETNFYLTEKDDRGFNFKKINIKDMGAVYENLARPYDDLDFYKSKIL